MPGLFKDDVCCTLSVSETNTFKGLKVGFLESLLAG